MGLDHEHIAQRPVRLPPPMLPPHSRIPPQCASPSTLIARITTTSQLLSMVSGSGWWIGSVIDWRILFWGVRSRIRTQPHGMLRGARRWDRSTVGQEHCGTGALWGRSTAATGPPHARHPFVLDPMKWPARIQWCVPLVAGRSTSRNSVGSEATDDDGSDEVEGRSKTDPEQAFLLRGASGGGLSPSRACRTKGAEATGPEMA